MIGLVAVLVALLAILTYFFMANGRTDDQTSLLRPPSPQLPVDEAMQLLTARWQTDLDAIHAHLREVHVLMDKLQQDMKAHARQQ
jgi:hypothetical protein